MVNIEEFTSRLKKVMDFHQLSASMFADKIGVQRSSISHILSGRNKPSLDFILKVIAVFTDVDMYWLLKGKGSFPKKLQTPSPSSSSSVSKTNNISLFDNEPKNNNSSKKIQRIVIFYSDGTFEEYLK